MQHFLPFRPILLLPHLRPPIKPNNKRKKQHHVDRDDGDEGGETGGGEVGEEGDEEAGEEVLGGEEEVEARMRG